MPTKRRRQFAICTPSPRRAFTLVEVLLVLVLIVIISGVTWTAVEGPLAQQRLSSAADAVRTQWCHARVNAMKSGHTYSFRYAVHGDHYQLGPETEPGQPDASQAAAAAPSPSDDDLGEDSLPPAEEKTLPTGIKFLPCSSGGDLSAPSDESESESVDDSADWSEPIFFFADGSTSDAQLVLANDRHSAVRLMLRGVTGSVMVGDVTALTQ